MAGSSSNSKRDVIREQVDILGIPPKEMLQKEIARQERGAAYKRLMWRILTCMVVSAAVIVLITNIWVTVLQIEGSSMAPLLEMNDIVLTVMESNPERNDIVAFNHNNKLHVKRVIAVAGDRVSIDENGVVSVNGRELNEPYISQLSLGTCDLEFPFSVPAGTVFVLGDNRPQSMDSRDSTFGVIGKDQIIGRVTIRVWPLARFGELVGRGVLTAP